MPLSVITDTEPLTSSAMPDRVTPATYATATRAMPGAAAVAGRIR